MDKELFGLKRRKSSDSCLEGLAFTFEERAELFEDLLEEDRSSLPLLEAPHEVLAAVGACLGAGELAALSELCAQAHRLLDEAFADAWTALLLRDYMPRSRAKRYRTFSATTGKAQRAVHHSAGLVLTVVDMSRIEWDGMLVAAPPHLRYRFLQTMGVLTSRWGRLAQSWEWFATRVMHRMTHKQLESLVPAYHRPSTTVGDVFDEVSHQASMDRNLRQRHSECNPQDVIASMKRRLGIENPHTDHAENTRAAAVAGEEATKPGAAGAAGSTPDDALSAMAPTARDQRLQQAERAASGAKAVSSGVGVDFEGVPSTAATMEMPPPEVIDRMSFSEQLDLAVRISQKPDEGEAPVGEDCLAVPAAAPALPPRQPAEDAVGAAVVLAGEAAQSLAVQPGAVPAGEGNGAVLLQLKTSGSCLCATQTESLEVVLRDFTVGEAIAIPEQIRRSLEQIVLRLARGNWLLFYEGIALEAQLRARTVAHHCRLSWLRGTSPPARRLVDLEAVLLQLPLYETDKVCPVPSELTAVEDTIMETSEQERQLGVFLEAWEEHEAWAASLEEHVGPLDLEVSRERSNNLQHGRAHTPYAVDLCRLAFRNFAICEGRLFFALAMAVYGLTSRLFEGRGSEKSLKLLEALHSMAQLYSVQDDALAAQRSTLQEYRYYLMEPLRRACERLAPAWHNPDEEGEDAYTEACA